jgi:hypothetical protein
MTKKIDKASHLPKKIGTRCHSVGCGTLNQTQPATRFALFFD